MRRVFAYGVAIATLLAAVLLRWLLDPVMGDNLPLVTLFGAVAAAVWVGGARAGILVTGLGYPLCSYLFIPPRGTLSFGGTANMVGLVAYLGTCALIIYFGEAMRKAQFRAAEQRELIRVTLRSIGDAVITTDLEGNITYLNAVAESVTGWKQAEALGQPLNRVFNIVNESTRLAVASPAMVALRDGLVVGLANHTVLIRKNGTECPIDDSAAPIRDENGTVSGCVLVFRDVTERQELDKGRADQYLTARLLASIVESSDDAIISKSLEGVTQTWNAAAERLFGYSAEEAIGKHISLIIPSDRIQEEDRIIASLKAGLRVEHYETERVRKDGQRILVSLTISPIKDETGTVVGASKIVRDVTRQRESEERERQLFSAAGAANTKFSAFFEQGALLAGIISLDGVVLEANRLSWEACGYTKEQIVGKLLWDAPWWESSNALGESIKAAFGQAVAGETFRAEVPYCVSGGSQRVADVTIAPIRDESGNVLFLALTGIDITDRRAAEADRERFVTLIESSTDFIGMCDLDGIPFFINRAGLEMVGLDSIEQARSVPVREFFFPEDQHRIIDEFFPEVLEKGHGEVEVQFRNFKTGRGRWMAYKLLTLKDAAGKPVALATVSQDVTERKRMSDNLLDLTQDLSEADRRKNEFLAILAHELRNPLAPITNAVHVLGRTGASKAAVQAATEMLERQVAQITRLVDDLLDISRISRGKIELRKERVELEPIIRQAIETTEALYRSMKHELHLTIPSRPIYLNADPARLAQVLGNLLNNACKFTDKGGRIAIIAEMEATQVVIRVRDTGIGISSEQMPHLFDMFTQADTALERSRDGLGIGLTLVKTLVEMHAGTVAVHSGGLGQGSEFVVRVPAAEEETYAQRPAAAQTTPVIPHRILVVDDNLDGAESLSILLESHGHQTEVAQDGLAALAAAEQFLPNVVLLDIGLPNLNGFEVCRRIRLNSWGKKICIVALTGWGQEEDRNKSRDAGFDTHMVKPIDYDVLMKLLATIEPAAAVQQNRRTMSAGGAGGSVSSQNPNEES